MLLNHALGQTGWQGEPLTAENWKSMLADRIKSYNWKRIIENVRPFLERPDEIRFLNQENLFHLLYEAT
ncbi:hypothetical protein JXJ21_16880 [candidate division KSB1 bacterium]|nr:hypothetical protein [candidate division KSB1 bacterium]